MSVTDMMNIKAKQTGKKEIFQHKQKGNDHFTNTLYESELK